MTKLVSRYLVLLALALNSVAFASPGGQSSPVPGSIKQAGAGDSIDAGAVPTISASGLANQRYNYALDAEDEGNAVESMEVLRQVFIDLMKQIKGMPAGSNDYFNITRQAVRAGYRYAWSLADDRKSADVEEIVNQLREILQPYDIDIPPPALHLPIAEYHWLKSRLLQEAGDEAGGKRESDRTLALTSNLDVFRGDYVALAEMRFRVLFDKWDAGNYKERHAQACALAQDIFVVRPQEYEAGMLIDCDLDHASDASSNGRFAEAQKSIEDANNQIEDFTKKAGDTVSVAFRLRAVDVELAWKFLASAQNDEQAVTRHQLEAAERFITALKGRAYFQRSSTEISDKFYGFKDVDLSLVPEYSDKGKRDAKYLDLFSRIADAVEVSRAAYPNSPVYAVASGESLARVAQFKLDHDDLAGSDAASAKAEASMDETKLIAGLHDMTERAETECLVRDRRIRVLIALDRADDALKAFRRMDDSCGDWVRRYPWEFYARQYVESAAWRLGSYLHLKHRYVEALPLLQFASNWGDGEASFYLADMYRTGHGVPADASRAKALYKLAASQSMKRFTVPTAFGAVKSPFYVYIRQYGPVTRCKPQAAALDPTQFCAGYNGIDDQVIWVHELRGGDVPKDVIDSFQKLDKIARDNDVSFPELAVYALAAAQKEQAGSSPKTPADANGTANKTAPEPLTDVPPTVTDTSLFALDSRGAKTREIETRIIPFIPNGGCFHWQISVPPEHRQVEVRTVIDYPKAPVHRPVSANASWENQDRRWVSRKVISLSDGSIVDSICQEIGDPLGPHHLEVFSGEKSLYSVDFELVPNDGLFEWNYAESRLSGDSIVSAQSQSATNSSPAPDGAGLDSVVVILLQGKNLHGEPMFCYLQITLRDLKRLRDGMQVGTDYEPGDYGTVLAEGNGEPDAGLRARMAENYKIYDTGKGDK
ncbi:MAG TPA: DUF2610 domain-containing protein [Rhizomicrobium sp.]|jgi:hypothetical protein